jgi:amino acid adenylation domain-containing protein
VIFQVLRSDGEVDGSHDADGGVPPAGEIAAKFDLSFTLQDRPGAIEAFVEYNTDLYDADTVTQLCAHYVNLARALVAAPEQCIGDAAMLSADEEQHLRVHSNATEADFGPPTCLHTLVERAAAAHPDAIAVEDEYGRTMSYAALDASANRLAQRLRGLGAAPQRIVGIHLERTPDMVVAILAALKAGAAYLPLDPDYPAQRLAYMLDDADAAVLVTRATLAPLPASGATAVLDIDRERDALARMSDAPVATAVQPEHLAYVIYTSGSTGRPKGVMVPHRAIVNHMHWMLSRFAFGAHDAVLQKTPIGFDASVWEVFAPLMAGARLVLARQGAHRDAAHLVQAVARHRISVLQFVPSQLRLVLDEPGLAQCDALRLLFCGGEPLPAELCVRWRERHAAELHNLYGPTEAAIDATSAPCSAIGRDDAVPIGTPIANVQAHVLDRYGNLVPRGVVGVLYLGGAGLACGYLGLPELTADRFVPDPFADRPGARLYDTGDRVRRRRDGALEFVGRIDEQLKLRGYRIEPAELARALESHPQVRQAVAVVRHGADGEPRLAAYAVTAVTTEEAVATSALRAHLRTLLPDYMMPAWITLLPELPRTPHGKIDWQALPEPQADAPAAHSVPAAPAPALEQRVAALWAEVLVRADVGIDDNFFDLGGYSLLMVQIQHRLRAALDAEVALLDLFRYPTVRLLCAHLKQRTQDTPAALPRAPASAEPAARRPSMQSRPLFRRPAP